MKISRSQIQSLIKKSLLSESTFVDEEGNLRDASSGVIIEPGTPGLSDKSKKGTKRFQDSEILDRDRKVMLAQQLDDADEFTKKAETMGNLLLVGGGVAASLMGVPWVPSVAIGLLGGVTTARDAFRMFAKQFAKPGGKVKLAQISNDVAEAFALDDEILEVLHPELIDQTIDIYEREIIDPARERGARAFDVIALKDFLKKVLKEKSLGQIIITAK